MLLSYCRPHSDGEWLRMLASDRSDRRKWSTVPDAPTLPVVPCMPAARLDLRPPDRDEARRDPPNSGDGPTRVPYRSRRLAEMRVGSNVGSGLLTIRIVAVRGSGNESSISVDCLPMLRLPSLGWNFVHVRRPESRHEYPDGPLPPAPCPTPLRGRPDSSSEVLADSRFDRVDLLLCDAFPRAGDFEGIGGAGIAGGMLLEDSVVGSHVLNTSSGDRLDICASDDANPICPSAASSPRRIGDSCGVLVHSTLHVRRCGRVGGRSDFGLTA